MYYFLAAITEQQRKSSDGYSIKKTVLAVIVLTQPYKINKQTGMVLKDNMMKLDFDMKNFKGDLIRLWKHNLVFLNSHSKYKDKENNSNYMDWLHLIRQSIVNKTDFKLNLKNHGIAKAVKLINYDYLTDEEIVKAKISEAKRRTRIRNREEIRENVEKKYKKKLDKKMKLLKKTNKN